MSKENNRELFPNFLLQRIKQIPTDRSQPPPPPLRPLPLIFSPAPSGPGASSPPSPEPWPSGLFRERGRGWPGCRMGVPLPLRACPPPCPPELPAEPGTSRAEASLVLCVCSERDDESRRVNSHRAGPWLLISLKEAPTLGSILTFFFSFSYQLCFVLLSPSLHSMCSCRGWACCWGAASCSPSPCWRSSYGPWSLMADGGQWKGVQVALPSPQPQEWRRDTGPVGAIGF